VAGDPPVCLFYDEKTEAPMKMKPSELTACAGLFPARMMTSRTLGGINLLLVGLLLTVTATAARGEAGASAGSPGPAQAPAAAFQVDRSGIVSPAPGPSAAGLDSLAASTRLAGCRMVGKPQVTTLRNGGMEFRKNFEHGDGGHACLLVERFTPAAHGLRWEIEIQGRGKPWTTAIETRLEWKGADGLTWWTAWGDNRPDAPQGKRDGHQEAAWWWADPLVPAAFADTALSYGGRSFTQPQAFCIPLVSVLDANDDAGISLVLSPEDLMLDVNMKVTRDGSIHVSRTAHRIAAERPVTFAMDLIRHPSDWRSGLAWMVERYPRFFDPENPRVGDMAGCGAYSSHARDFDAQRLKRMAFRVNWKASFDFPYMGMFVPPVPDDTTEWTDMKSKPNSISRVREDIRCFKDMGFDVLSYFNVTEFGLHIALSPPERKAARDEDLWKDPNDYVWHVLKDAILMPDGSDKPIHSWEGCIAMDPGDPVYQRFLVDQARLHLKCWPESSGICIDRMDWLCFYNSRFDDGRSWVNDKPARSLVVSWHEVIRKIGAVMHDNDKVIYCNPHYRRVDLLRHIDGIYDEFGQMGHSMNLCALMALRKPVMCWTIMTPELKRAPDAYFQRHLHMGAYPTAPLPGNDHTILPSPDVDQLYFDYGPLLDALRGKQWVLKPHVVQVEGRVAKANLFSVPGGYVVPVTFGNAVKQARVELRQLDKAPGRQSFKAEVIHPGGTDWRPLAVVENDGVVVLDVPLSRGCAMVRIQ
jgi:hypothetical protein